MVSNIFLSSLLLAGAVATTNAATNTTANCAVAAIPKPTVVGAEITNLTATVINDYELVPGNDVCFVTVVLTHPGTGDVVNNWVVLPLTGWNGIFQGVGGGGFTAGNPLSLAAESAEGYASVATDAGHSDNYTLAFEASTWALISPGNVNQYTLLDFARRSYHDMTVLGKAITESFYGEPAKYSYWNGCSTGGRQGMVMAQYYPEDYDGILAEAPAIQWNDFTPAQQWPYTVENNEGYVPAQCEFDAVNRAVIAACDAIDGQVDGIISAPALCNFTATSLIGKTYTCDTDNTTHTFTQKTADVINKIWEGPRTPEGQFLWYGPTKGTNFSSQALTITVNGTTTAVPFGISDTWISGFLAKNLTFDTANITYAQFTEFFLQGHIEYDSIMGSASPDLRAFSNKGGKIITWQGLADNFISPQGTMLYYHKVAAIDPTLHNFYRQFYSPGVGHCGGGTGVQPVNAIGQLRAWVENGTAPATLAAASEYPVNASSAYPINGTNVRTMDLCAYPEVNKYDGKGDPALASSYNCIADSGWERFAGPSGTNYSCVGGPGWY